MAEFQEVFHNWQRMCKAVQDGNKCKISVGWCDKCPLHGNCWVVLDFKDCSKEEMNGIEETVQNWAKENPEPVYPTWAEWLEQFGLVTDVVNGKCGNFMYTLASEPIPQEVAQKYGIELKGE